MAAWLKMIRFFAEMLNLNENLEGIIHAISKTK